MDLELIHFQILGALLFSIGLYGVLARPVVAYLNGVANAIVRRLGVEPVEDIETTPDRVELEQLIVSSGEEGVLDPAEVQRCALGV